MQVVNQLSDLYELCAVCDVDQSAGEAAAAQFDIPAVHTDLHRMLETERPDVVLRLTPTDSAVATCIVAAQHGCHVINEIPFDFTRQRADLIRQACDDSGVKLEIAENVWLWPQERLKQLIVSEGLLGTVMHARLTYPCGSYHGFNGVRMILRKDPVRVLGYGGTVPVKPTLSYGGEPMDTCQWDGAVLDFGEGLHCLFEMPPKKAVWERRWDIVGTHGHLAADTLYLYEQKAETAYPIENLTEEIDGEHVLKAVRVNTTPVVEWENPFARYKVSDMDGIAKAAILQSMYDAITQDIAPLYGAENGRKDQELCIAMKQSAWQGSIWLDLPLGEITAVEQRLHEAFEERYGCDALGDIEAQLKARYARGAVMWDVAGWL